MKTPIYLDYMASTPIDPKVLERMIDCLKSPEMIGNPSSNLHVYGRYASAKIEQARQQVADLICALPQQIIFTSGGTEAINTAIKGAAFYYQRQGKHIITAKTEHKAVLNAVSYLSSLGFEVTYLNVNPFGLIDVNELKNCIRHDTILVSLMHVNNETGVIQDIQRIGEILRQKSIIFHVDAVQSVGKLAMDMRQLPVDLMSFSAHKMYGPKGIGALYIAHKPKVNLIPLIHGGGQENGLRSGTPATHQIVGLGAACLLAKEEMQQDKQHIAKLSADFWQGLSTIPGMHLNADSAARMLSCFNVRIDGIIARDLLVKLHDKIAASPGSACTSAMLGAPSHVLTAMGLSDEQSLESFRLSFGRYTTELELKQAVEILKNEVQQQQRQAN